MKERDKFTKLLLQDNIQKEKKWDDRFVLEKIPQYDAFKDPNYLSLSLLKTKTKIDEKNTKNKQTNIKKRIYSSHYSINSLNKKHPSHIKNNYEELLNNKNNYNNNDINQQNMQINKKRPNSIYLNRNHLSFLSNINNSNSKIDPNNTNTNNNQNIFYNFFSNKLKNQKNNTNLNTYTNINNNNNNNDINSLNDIYTSKTTKNTDLNKLHNYIKFKESSYQNLENNYSFIKKDKNLLNELKTIKEIWNEICVTLEYQTSFEEMIDNLDNKEEIKNILNNEKKQITQFKNDFLKLMNVISKRETSIENIKKLDKIFLQNKKLTQFNKLVNEKNRSEPNFEKIDDNFDELEEKNKEQIETDINNSLKLLRINTVNAMHQFNKFRTMNNYLLTCNKIDINKLKNNYGYNKDYLIKLKNDLDFLAYSNINTIYNFKKNDPFLVNLIPGKNDEDNQNKKFKKLPASEELISTINNSLYILTQEELLHKMKYKTDIKRNKSNGFESKEHKYIYDDTNPNTNNITKNNNLKNNNNNNNNSKGKNINFFKIKSQKEYNKLFFKNTKINDKTVNDNNNNINNDNKLRKIKNLYFNNITKEKEKNNEKISEIPTTSAAQLQKKFDFYNKLKQDLTDRNEYKEENNKNDNTKSDNNTNKENEDNNDNNEEKNKFKYIWFKDTFNNYKNIYNEYFNKLSKKTIELFSLNRNANDLIHGINPKIIICQKNNNKIYGICAISYLYDNGKLILKINHLSSLEKDEDDSDNTDYLKENMEYKIYEKFIEMIKSLPYEIIELNLYINEQNKELLNIFINNYKFEIKEEEKNENIDNKPEENDTLEKKTLRIYNNNYNNDDENVKRIIESGEIKYNNTSIISIIGEEDVNNNNNNNNELEKETKKMNINKYFYKFINTFNLNILINFLTKDNIYTLINSSNEKITSFTEDIPNYSTLFIKDKNNNIDNIINIIPDCSLIETNDKIKHAYITSILNTKLSPFISTIYNKKIYNVFNINLSKKNKDKNIYIINSSDEKINYYIYQCEDDSDIKKEINKNSNDNFNIFEYFNKLIEDNTSKEENIENKGSECIIAFNLEESKEEEKKLLWVPSFSIDTQLICDKIPILEDVVIKNSEEKQFKINEYTEILKISYGCNETNSDGFIFEPNLNEDLIIDKDFIFAISHKDIKNQFNNSIAFLVYITKDNFINSN